MLRKGYLMLHRLGNYLKDFTEIQVVSFCLRTSFRNSVTYVLPVHNTKWLEYTYKYIYNHLIVFEYMDTGISCNTRKMFFGFSIYLKN